jgi:nitrite reductase/ring-hydroxylating ferredoxin subunit
MKKTALTEWDKLPDRQPTGALVSGVDLVIVRFDDRVSVLYGRCAHRGALMADGYVSGRQPDLRGPPVGLPHGYRHQ